MENDRLTNDIISAISSIEDVRRYNKRYPLAEILFLTLTAIMSDCESWESISDFGEEKLSWLREYFPYKNGIPSEDTLVRVLGRIKSEQMENCMKTLAVNHFQKNEGRLLQIDGKSLNGTATSLEKQTKLDEGGKKTNHLLHLWCSEYSLCLAQKEVPSKNGEPSQVGNLIKDIDITGCTVSMDAIFCKKHIAKTITDAKANYILAAKNNNKKLRNEIELAFDTIPVTSTIQTITKHGRIEERTYSTLPAEGSLATQITGWTGLNTIVACKRYRKSLYTETTKINYFITSLPNNIEFISHAIRSHWSIESGLHWQLDVSFGEDNSKTRQDKAAINLSAIRKMVLNLFNTSAVKGKLSIPRMRKKCLMNDDFRAQCLSILNTI